MIFGLLGACRTHELLNCSVEHFEHREDLILVKIPDTKNHQPRSFVINGEYLKIVQKYAALRQPNTNTKQFFVQYRNGKCTGQVIGKHSFGKIAQSIAAFLNLENPEKYTGHSYRRTAATIFVDDGASTHDLQRLGGWKSAAVAQSYVDESMNNKKKAADRFTNALNLPSTSKNDDELNHEGK